MMAIISHTLKIPIRSIKAWKTQEIKEQFAYTMYVKEKIKEKTDNDSISTGLEN
jgi:hypothetical protein